MAVYTVVIDGRTRDNRGGVSRGARRVRSLVRPLLFLPCRVRPPNVPDVITITYGVFMRIVFSGILVKTRGHRTVAATEPVRIRCRPRCCQLQQSHLSRKPPDRNPPDRVSFVLRTFPDLFSDLTMFVPSFQTMKTFVFN